MKSYELTSTDSIGSLISATCEVDEPVIVSGATGDCLIAMQPAVFEDLLYGSSLLECADRSTLHF